MFLFCFFCSGKPPHYSLPNVLQYFKDDQGWTNLFAKKAPTWWTLPYWCQRQPPEGSFLRLTPVYGTSDKQQEVIQR
ncbi:unnamed protein product [Protopolystoma xenopodis]|uniref:Uncharacterized protein n=1 Tax=Protopolystoma xenopodis TaxID=117903 RepID=A0A448X029_9PLAT|nr:unnamed protein product [Protopolystoma xenopodis]